MDGNKGCSKTDCHGLGKAKQPPGSGGRSGPGGKRTTASGHAPFLSEGAACEHGGAAQDLLDAEQFVVFGDSVRAGGRAGLDLAAVGGDGDVGDGGVLGFTGAMAEDGLVPAELGELDSVEGFGQGTDLVDLDEDGVGGGGVDS